ncbi:MAG: hypothetical protein O2779_03185 [Nanoarchaeota archaeon]|nr:hypothetical protein [Nanoarchaeota archaeon]
MIKINDVSAFKIVILLVLLAVLWMMVQKLVLFNDTFTILDAVGLP